MADSDRLDESSEHSEFPGSNAPQSAAGRGRFIVIAATFALVAVPLLWSLVPVEIARWYQASALEAELEGDLGRARAAMDKAVSWCPTEPTILTARAGLHLEEHDLQAALQDCNHALELDPEGFDALYFHRALAYQRLGQHDKALADVEQIVRLAAEGPHVKKNGRARNVMFTYDRALNLRAYSRALAGVEISAALDDIDEAIKLAGKATPSAYLDTRGYLRYLAGDLPGAEADMKVAIEENELELQRVSSPLTPEATAADPNLTDSQYVEQRTRQLREDLAVMYQHRGLILEKRGQQAEADADFVKAKEFGYSPENGVW